MFYQIAFMAVVLSAVGCTTAAERGASAAESVRATFTTVMPKTNVTAIRPTPISGLYEITAGRNVFYVDAEVKHIVVGSIYDIRAQRDLTATRINEVSKINFKAMPEQDAIVIKQGTGKHEIAVFSDPDCPFCKKIEPELAKLKDTTIYVYLMPLPMHTEAANRSARVWCEKDRAKAWRDLMLSGRQPAADASCDQPVARTAALAKNLGIKATPTLVSPDGRVQPGFMKAEEIEHWMAQRGGKS